MSLLLEQTQIDDEINISDTLRIYFVVISQQEWNFVCLEGFKRLKINFGRKRLKHCLLKVNVRNLQSNDIVEIKNSKMMLSKSIYSKKQNTGNKFSWLRFGGEKICAMNQSYHFCQPVAK